MNIWYFHHYATPYEIPGLHRPFEFGTYFNELGNKIAVFTSSYLHYSGDNMISGSEMARFEHYDGVDAVFVKTCGYETKVKRVLNMFQFSQRLFKTARRFIRDYWRPDVIVASSPHPLTMLAGLKIAKKLGIPCICEVRDFWPEVFFMGGVIKEKSLIGRVLTRGERYIYEKSDRLVFLKEGDHTYISDHRWDVGNGGKIDLSKCVYINNGVDIKLFDRRVSNYLFDDPDLESDKFNAVYCGTIRPVNNIDMLLDVAKLTPDINYLIFGSGNCVGDLEKRIECEHIVNVKLKGYVDNKYIPYILSKASVNILNYSGTSYNWSRGNSSNKLFEYLASGKPVVSTVKMGYDIIERYGCGFSAEKCTAECVAEVIKKVYDLSKNDYEAICRKARSASEDFDISILAHKYMCLLEKTTGKDNENG